MQNLNLLEFLAKAFQCHVHHFKCLAILVELTVMVFITRKRTPSQPVPAGKPSIENGAHAKYSSEDFA